MPPKKPETRARHWVFTLNNPSGDDVVTLNKNADLGQFKFYAWQLEKGKDAGTPHIQGYVGLHTQMYFSKFKSLLPGNPHVEMCRDPKAAYAYCQKNDTYVPGGERKSSDDEPPSATDGIKGNVWDRFAAACRVNGLEGERTFLDILRDYPILYKEEKGTRKLFEEYCLPPLDVMDLSQDAPVHAECYYGAPGVGKSLTVKQILHDTKTPFYRQFDGKWFDGYNYQKVLWIDDMEPGRFKRAQFMQLLDRGPCRVETKGGHATARFDSVFITSNYDPVDWFMKEEKKFLKSEEIGAATIRRMTVFKIYKDIAGKIQIEKQIMDQQQGNTIPAVAQATITALLKARQTAAKTASSPKGHPSTPLSTPTTGSFSSSDDTVDEHDVEMPMPRFKRQMLERSAATAIEDSEALW